MTNKTVEERIREHYQVKNGEWLVEKNKVKEARLLKEAVERIDVLRNAYEKFYELYNQELLRRDEKVAKRMADLDLREERLRKRERDVSYHINNAKIALTGLSKLDD